MSWTGHTPLGESPGQVQVKMCLSRHIPKALGGWQWDFLLKMTMSCGYTCNISIGLVREVSLRNVEGRSQPGHHQGMWETSFIVPTSGHCALSHVRKERSCRLE